jgi:hypothetical protein
VTPTDERDLRRLPLGSHGIPADVVVRNQRDRPPKLEDELAVALSLQS